MDIKNILRACRLLPLLDMSDGADALPLALALADAGITAAAVDINFPCALDVISVISKNVPEISMGAYYLRTPAQAVAARYSGAAFVVASSLSGALVRDCQRAGIDVIPSVATSCEVERAIGLDVELAAFWPACALGGAQTLGLFGQAFPSMTFLAAGGITLDSLSPYLNLPNVAAAVCPLAAGERLSSGRTWEELTAPVAAALRYA